MKKTRSTALRLRSACEERQVVRFATPFGGGTVAGWVLGIGTKWFLLAVVRDGVRFNGFACHRIADVRRLEAPARQAAFVVAALRANGERRVRRPRVELTNLSSLLRSAGRRFPLVTIHREKVNPNVCHIGRLLSVSTTRVTLQEIDPDAKWCDEVTAYPLREITQVNFDMDYERALRLVGGEPSVI